MHCEGVTGQVMNRGTERAAERLTDMRDNRKGEDWMYTYIVIDDEPLIRRGTVKKLENYPDVMCVAQASNGKSALELIEEKDPDFIITDMKMPIMDGTQLLPVLSTQYPEKYIIVISGYKDFNYAKEALRANTLDYIVKPFSQETLWNAVNKAIELLKNKKSLYEKLSMNEQEKESLKYEYDRQSLCSMLFGNGKELPSFSSQKMCRLMENHRFAFLTVTLSGKVNEKVLTEFLSMRKLETQTVLLARDNIENLYFLLMFFPKEKECGEEDVLEVKELLDCLWESMQISPFYGISEIHDGLPEVTKAYSQSVEALNHMTLNIKENSLFFDTSDFERKQEETVTLKWPKLERFLFLVEAGKTSEVETVFPELFHYFARTEKCRLKDAKEYCLEIAEILKKSLPRDLQVHKSTATSLNLINNLNLIFRFQELEEYFNQFFRNMSVAFDDAGFYSEKDVLENVKNYIDLHYEKDLTQEFVAALFRLNRSYLSSAFKARMGISFVDYVNKVRISHAKELLKNTSKKMYQIAQAVGYENVKYFFRVFKKMEGVTPEQYRNRTEQ